MVALKLPKSYLFQDDIAVARTSIAAQDIRFARTAFRIQQILSSGLKELALRHLMLKGFPQEDTKGLEVLFTAPSDFLELSRMDLITGRYNLAGSVKGSQIYDDYTILTNILKHTDEEAVGIIDRLEKQLLRQQELQAQSQVFAQLAQTPPGEQLPGTPEIPIPPGGEQPPEGEQPPAEIPEEEIELQQPAELPKLKKPKRYTDFENLEADEEETDLEYEE